MNSWQRNRQMPLGNPLANALVVIVGVLAIGLSIVLGVVAFIALGSLFIVLGAIVAIRLWWAQRKFRKQARARGAPGRDTERTRVEVIEGEYQVVTRHERERNS